MKRSDYEIWRVASRGAEKVTDRPFVGVNLLAPEDIAGHRAIHDDGVACGWAQAIAALREKESCSGETFDESTRRLASDFLEALAPKASL